MSLLSEGATMLAGHLADEFTTSIQVRVITETTSPLGGSSPTTSTTLVTTTTGLAQELSRAESIEADLTGERRAARVFLTEYTALEAGTHVLTWSSLDWEVRRVLQLAGSHTEAVVELMSDG